MPRRHLGSDGSPAATAQNFEESGAKRFRCSTCQQWFKKAEHLEKRHARSHLKQKPFACPTCSKSFGRKDVLSRHEKLHGHITGSDVVDPVPTFETRETPGAAEAGQLYCSLIEPQDVILSSSLSNQTPISMADVSESTDLSTPHSWMASGDMLEILMSDFSPAWPLSLPLPMMAVHPSLPLLNSTIPRFQPLIAEATSGAGHQAMDQMSRLIAELSANLTAEIQSNGITSAFLDTCAHVFFDRFIPSFPILNKNTFNLRESSHPLLLNIIALGSLFIGAKGAIQKGECLWKLAHTTVATNWAKLMAIQGPRDRCKGVQLLLTALTGQTYAILSQNESIRSTAQIFHGLGFFWAKQCRMYDDEGVTTLNPSFDAGETEKVEAWKVWMAYEVQNRAVLGHYILDGHISQFSGNSACSRHVTNPLSLPASDALFNAASADDWMKELEKLSVAKISFREIFVLLFSPNLPMPNISVSKFGIRVILEGLQSLVSDIHEANGPAIGTPSKTEISQALLRLYNEQLRSDDDKLSVDNMELLIRWNSVCLDLATPATKLCRNLCASYFIEQKLHDGTWGGDSNFDLASWARTPDAYRALLHSMAIQDITDRLPLGRSHAPHLPAAVFAASTIYSGFCLAGISSISHPCHFLWEDVWPKDTTGSSCIISAEARGLGIRKFLQGSYHGGSSDSTSRNLTYDLNSLQIMLNSLSRWGVSQEMSIILQEWNSAATHESWPMTES